MTDHEATALRLMRYLTSCPNWCDVGEKEPCDRCSIRIGRITAALKAAERDALERAAQCLGACRVVHVGYPPLSTCLDKQRCAKEHPEQYSDEHRKRVLAGEYLCGVCSIRALIPKEDNDDDDR